MRFIHLISFVLLSYVLWPLYPAVAQTSDRTVEIGISDIFIPANISSQQHAVILMQGLLSPKGCLKWDGYSISHESAFIHVVKANATVTGLVPCSIRPFVKEVDLGVLEDGTHTVRYLNFYLEPASKTFEVRSR